MVQWFCKYATATTIAERRCRVIRLLFTVCSALLTIFHACDAAMAGESLPEIVLTEEMTNGEHAVIMENAYYRCVMIPGKAMLPAIYLYKPTNHDVFLRRSDIKESFANLDGFYDCLPWVSDRMKRGASKGLLRTAIWQTRVAVAGDCASAVFATEIAYPDFGTGQTSRLAFVKTLIGSNRHAQLRMDYEVENRGQSKARFILVGHARVAGGGTYDSGDYVYVPGTNCWLGEFKWLALAKKGVIPYSWTSWPMEDIVDFVPRDGSERKGDYVYAFVPASWAVVGDEKSKEYTVFQCSPVRLGKTVIPVPYWCVLHRDGDYLLELCLSRNLDAGNWNEPWATVGLEPGEKATFTIWMTPGQGFTKVDFESVTEATPDRLVISGTPGESPGLIRLTPQSQPCADKSN